MLGGYGLRVGKGDGSGNFLRVSETVGSGLNQDCSSTDGQKS